MRQLPITIPNLLLAATLAMGCNSRQVASIEPGQVKEDTIDVPIEANRNIDILFVIDNSGSPADLEAQLNSLWSQLGAHTA